MSGKRSRADASGGEWITTFADLMTLFFCFVDHVIGKAERV